MKFSWGTGVTLTMMAFIALMAGFMIKAIQEQQAIIEGQQKQIDDLRLLVDKLSEDKK